MPILEQCFQGISFISMDSSGQKFFGFSEFLAGLALMVLAWTNGDIRYRFRIWTAPIRLVKITFYIVALIGTLTLLTDLWRAEAWLVPQGRLLTQHSWQALLGATFLLTFLVWAWFAFIRPPKYGKYNAVSFAQVFYHQIIKGSATELAVMADELKDSASSIVKHATNQNKWKVKKVNPANLPVVEAYANHLLAIIGDKRFCRIVVQESPGLVLELFREINLSKKYNIPIDIFARNIVNEALDYKESFLYYETEAYDSGLIGYQKPLCQALFSNYEMVETIGTLLDPDVYGKKEWDSDKLEAYCRVVLITLKSYVNDGNSEHSFALYRAKGHIENAVSDLYKLDGQSNTWDTDQSRRLKVVAKFIKTTIHILNEQGLPEYIQARIRPEIGHPTESIYDNIASLIFEVITHASSVSSPRWECWSIQHNYLWSELFSYIHKGSPAGKMIQFKLRRLLYDEIAGMNPHPDYKRAKILGFCLNVMGLSMPAANLRKDSLPLHKAVLSWTKKNYVWLQQNYPDIAESCLVEGITYDSKNFQLIHTSSVNAFRQKPRLTILELNFPKQEPNCLMAY
jgi:hypothetical protein